MLDDDSGPILLEKHQLQTSAAKFLMNIRDGMCLSQRATDAVVQGGKGLVSGMLHNLHQIVRGKVEDGASAEEIDHWIMFRNGITWGIHYLDDFLFCGIPDSNECSRNLDIALYTCIILSCWEPMS